MIRHAFATLLVSAALLLAEPTTAASTKASEYQELWQALFGYWTAARVCGDPDTIETAENSFRRGMNYGRHNGLLPEVALQFEANPEVYLAGGEDMYRRQQWVGCEYRKQ
jgi:hypothetical protein